MKSGLIFRLLMMAAVTGALGAMPRGDLLGKLPLRFEENLGREPDGQTRFVARGRDFALSLSPAESRLQWGKSQVRTRLKGANANPRLTAEARLAGAANYFVGAAADRWRQDVPGYGRIRYQEVYPGIDLVFHGEEGRLEYDFLLAPHADPGLIRLEVSGEQELRVSAEGDLVVATAAGEIRWKRPEAYQELDGRRAPVASRFVLGGHGSVAFEVGGYDRARELVIDPTLSYATYLGGSANDGARGIARDAAGNIYIAGNTTSPNLPTRSAVQPNYGGTTASAVVGGDAFVAKFSPAGALVYLTYLGGSGDEGASAIAVDGAGNAYLTGTTSSSNFPVSGSAAQPAFGGMGGNQILRTGDAFVTKLNPAGNQLLYSTYLGGSADDGGTAIAIDGTGNAYVAGVTVSLNFPATAGVYQTRVRGKGGQPIKPCCGLPFWESGDAFVVKVNPNGTQWVFATLLGGARDEVASSIALDAGGNVYVGGYTLSEDFPTTANALQKRFGGADPQNEFLHFGDGFIAKFNPGGTALVWSTLLGGYGDDAVAAIAVDGTGSVYMTGSTSRPSLTASSGALQKSYSGYLSLPFEIEQLFGDAFVAKLNADGSSLAYFTYLGGTRNDAGTAIAVDNAGNAYVAGFTESADFPTAGGPLQSGYSGGGGQNSYITWGDAFLAIVNPAATALLYASYYGGQYDDGAAGIVLDGSGRVHMVGLTVSPNLKPTQGALQGAYGGGSPAGGYAKGDGFYAVFSGFALPPSVGAVTNGASNLVQAVAPGMVYVAYGSGLGPDVLAGAQLDSNGRVATTVAESQMLFDGTPAPIVYSSVGQFAGVVPYSVAGKTSTNVVAVYKGKQSAAISVPVAATAPAVFSNDSTGSGLAAALNADGSRNSESNRAARGTIVTFFGTGEGLVTPTPVDGTVGSYPPVWNPVASISMTVGGAPAILDYSNTAPGALAGLLQINAKLSPDTPVGNQPVVLKVGAGQSQANLTVWVK